MSLSTTLYQTGCFIPPKYSAAALVSSSRNPLGDLDHDAAAHALAGAGLELLHLAQEVADRQTGNAGRFRMPAAAREMAERAGEAVRLAARGDHLRHRRVIFRIPVGRAEPVVDLRLGVLLGAARQRDRLRRIRRLRRRRHRISPFRQRLCRRLRMSRNRQRQQPERGNRNQSPHHVTPLLLLSSKRRPFRCASRFRNERRGIIVACAGESAAL